MSSINNGIKKTFREEKFSVLRQTAYTKLLKKYSSGDFSFEKISINNLVFNEECLVVARFKDFLIYDDNTDFLRRFYNSKDSDQRLKKILNFYEKYSKIFPNYLVLKENKYLYRNIRKKQKMIDAINEIKREEKENKKRLKEKGNINGKKNTENNDIFTKKIKDEIKTFQKNISFKKYKNSFDTDKDIDDTLMINQNSISISILNWKQYEKNAKNEEINDNNWGTHIDSFITNQTSSSISGVVNILNDNKIYTKELPNIFSQYNKKIKNPLQKQITSKNKSNNVNENTKKKITKKANTNNKILNTHSIKNNQNQINESKKTTINKNKLKYAKTSTNATNSSSILSKRIRNQVTSTSVHKNNKSNKENNNNNNNEEYNNDKNMLFTVNNVNTNMYNKTSPKMEQFKLKKHFYKTNYNFNKIKSSLSKNKEKNKISGAQKDKIVISDPNENIKKNYIKCRHISQNFDKNIVTKVTDNILNNNNKNVINNLTENINLNPNMNTNPNPNLITGDTKNNIKNNIEDKVHVNVRDIIKKNKEMEKEKEKENKKDKINIFHTAQKLTTQNKENLLLKFSKTKTNSNVHIPMHMTTRSLNFNDNKKRNILFSNQKTENKIINNNNNKKFMTKQLKSKTKPIFIKNKTKNLNNKNTNKEKEKEKEKEKNEGVKENIKRTENEKEIKKENNIIKKDENNDLSNKIKNNNIENNIKIVEKIDKIYDDIKSEPNHYENKNEFLTQREMNQNLSDSNMISIKDTLTPDINKIKNEKSNTITNNNHNNKYLNGLNNSAKLVSNDKKKFKTFLKKTQSKTIPKNNENYGSHKNIFSINILNHIQEANKNKTKNTFYRISKTKNSSEINNINSHKKVQLKHNKMSLIKTPTIKNKKINFFKKNSNNKRNNIGIKRKEEKKKSYISSFSIKVNKTYFNKDKDKKSKNLKKTLTTNIKNKFGKLHSNIIKDN